jgi:hypothetical protein
MKTLTFATGAAVGYVLGTKAGREKYQQIVDGARLIMQKPAVRQAQARLKDLVDQGTTAVSKKLGSGTDTGYATTSSDNEPAVTKTRTTPKKATAIPAPPADTTF